MGDVQGQGYIGQALGYADVLAVAYGHAMTYRADDPQWEGRDRFLLSHGHYAMVIILAMGIGLFAPPFGLGYYAACTIGRVNPDVAVRRIWPYLGALLFGLLIVAFVPWFSIGLL